MKNVKTIYFVILWTLVVLLSTGLTLAQESETALQGLLDQQVQEQDIFGMAMAVRLADGTVIILTLPEKRPGVLILYPQSAVSPRLIQE